MDYQSITASNKRWKQRELRDAFKEVVKGNNVMTPNVIGYYEIDDGIAELTSGEGMSRQPIFGVSVVQDGKYQSEMSRLFQTMDMAEYYITEELS